MYNLTFYFTLWNEFGPFFPFLMYFESIHDQNLQRLELNKRKLTQSKKFFRKKNFDDETSNDLHVSNLAVAKVRRN